jgi:hypothetical protein
MFPVLGQEGDGDPMHGAILADFSRCLHVRKRRYYSPSDLSNGPTKWVYTIHAETGE